MKRTAVIQDIINATKARIYLEIGVARGSNFFPIKARHKIGVDPRFGFGSRRKIKWYCMNLCNLHARYYEIESDAFFAQIRLEKGLDVVFVDGLHTYEQSFKDGVCACFESAGMGCGVERRCLENNLPPAFHPR